MTQFRPFWLHLFLAVPFLLNAQSPPPGPPPADEPPMFNTRNPKRPTYRPPTEKVEVVRPENFFAPAKREDRTMPDLGPGLQRDTNIDAFLPPDPKIVQPPKSPFENAGPMLVLPRGAKKSDLAEGRDDFLRKPVGDREGIRGLDDLADLTLAAESTRDGKIREEESGTAKEKDGEEKSEGDDPDAATLAGEKPNTPGIEPPDPLVGEPKSGETPQVGFTPVISAEEVRALREAAERPAIMALDARIHAMELTASGRNALREREDREQGSAAFSSSRKIFDSITRPHLDARQETASGYSLDALTASHRADFASAAARAASIPEAGAFGSIPDLGGPPAGRDPPLGSFAPVDPAFTLDAPPARIPEPALPRSPLAPPPAAALPAPVGLDSFQIRSGMDRLPGAPAPGRFNR